MSKAAAEVIAAIEPAPWVAPVLTVVVPTFNERDNVGALAEKLGAALKDIAWQMIVVDDDSPDGTADRVKELSRHHPHIQCIRRVGRRGLSSACIEGISASAAPYVAVIDADHQHDETILPLMLQKAQDGDDLVIGSRFAGGGSAGEGLSGLRLRASQTANWLSGLVSGFSTTDPMSGFFLMRRTLFDAVAPKLAPEGFKILLDILVTTLHSGRRVSISEVPYVFRSRNSGDSKMSPLIAIQFMGLWLSKLTGGLLPTTFLLFTMVGLSGLAVHMATLAALYGGFDFNFTNAQLAATVVAMTWNFFLNNSLTYADRRLHGARLWMGLLSFYAVCSMGALANISVASAIFNLGSAPLLAGLSGALMSSVFNYAVTRIFTWR